MSLYQRGTKVKFVGRFACPGTKHYVEKYGVQVGDKGTIVRYKNGWWRVSFTRQDGSRAVSVPMRADHFTEKPAEESDARDESSPIRPTSLLYGFELDGESSPVQPPMNENFGFDEPPTPDAVVADMKKEAVEEEMRVDPTCPDGFAYSRKDFVQFYGNTFVWDMVGDHQELPTPEHKACARLLIASRNENERLQLEVADYSVSMTDLIAELDRVKLRLISARTLLQLKDKTIAGLRGAPNFETWGDWVVPEVGSG
jgi:hypothetical protein